MPEVILQVYPALGDEEEMQRRRPIGRDNEAYQNMLDGLIELCQAADDLGYWGITHTVELLEGATDLAQEPLSERRQFDAATGAVNQRAAELVLERPETLADPGGGNPGVCRLSAGNAALRPAC